MSIPETGRPHLITPNILQPANWLDIAKQSETEWIIDSLIPKGKQVHIIGASGVGKSLLALDWALRIVEGTPVFGTYPTSQGRVLWLDWENGPGTMKERLEAYGYDEWSLDWFDDRLYYIPFPALNSLETQEAGTVIVNTCQHYGIETVIIDSVGVAFDGDENSSEAFRGFGRNTGAMLREANIAAVLLDNLGKDATRGSRGSSRKKDEADIQLIMQATPNPNDYTLKREKDRLGGVPDKIPIRMNLDPTLHWKTTVPRTLSDGAAKVINQLKKDGVTASVTLTSVRHARTLGVTGENRYVAEAVKWLKHQI